MNEHKPLEQRTVSLFRNGRNQAVRIPVEFELPGDEALISRDGDRLIIEPKAKKQKNIVEMLREMGPLGPDDRLPDIDDGGLPPLPKIDL